MCEYCDALPALKLVVCRRGYGSDKVQSSRTAAASGGSAERGGSSSKRIACWFKSSRLNAVWLFIQIKEKICLTKLAIIAVTSTIKAAKWIQKPFICKWEQKFLRYRWLWGDARLPQETGEWGWRTFQCLFQDPCQGAVSASHVHVSSQMK